ncbi:uncharacterized protein LOC110385619 [Bombyx mori]|uniref:Uncharacterized protein n=1 Tax=Bombyx mori TaxID=7091 RepID=A0A8R2HQW2_BOMMO|nr:uncharacterized protein LOC110385619 [Bombyx mori]
MTAELIRDADLKVRHADKIQSQYKNSVTYELGTIAAGIQDKYRHMLEIYRIYSNVTLHMAVNFTIYDSLNAYHVLQSDYNEIKVEQNLFYEVLAKHEGEKRKLEKLRKKQLDKMRGSLGFEGGGGRGRRLGNRKPALWRDGGAFEAGNFDFGADWK